MLSLSTTVLNFALFIGGLIASTSSFAADGFDQTLEQNGIRFRVSSPNDTSINRLTITPSGLEVSNSPKAVEIDGSVTGAEIADLDGNGWPEIYVYVNSAGSGSYGSLVAFAVNNGKSLSDIYLPPVMDDPKASAGYMGHDQFSIEHSTLVRRFPIYRSGDTNAQPTGGTRRLHYRLEPGEAGWVLRVEQITDQSGSDP